jgi:ribosomal protein L35
MKQRSHQGTLKRVKIRGGKKGKRNTMLHIAAGRGHFNAREPGKVTAGKRRHARLSESYRKSVKVLLPGTR